MFCGRVTIGEGAVKCVQNKDTDKIKRIADVEAMKLVFDGAWVYAPKSLWKARQRAGGESRDVKNEAPPRDGHSVQGDEPESLSREMSGTK
tara:strand:- start:16 stop:288 length:273 start_codon:yes stop_codon:yes gene_type:complete